jgi:hypothetical protein
MNSMQTPTQVRVPEKIQEPSGVVQCAQVATDEALSNDTPEGEITVRVPEKIQEPSEVVQCAQVVMDDVFANDTPVGEIQDGASEDPPVLHHVVFKELSNVCLNWKRSEKKLSEKYESKEIYFSVYVNANMGLGKDNVAIGSLIHLPCRIELAATPGQCVDALFVIRSKKRSVFAVLGVSGSFSFVHPVEISTILGFLPHKRAAARTMIGTAITEQVRRPGPANVPAKRVRCDSWQTALFDFCQGTVDVNTCAEQKAKLENLRAALFDNNRPAKAAKVAGVVGTL